MKGKTILEKKCGMFSRRIERGEKLSRSLDVLGVLKIATIGMSQTPITINK